MIHKKSGNTDLTRLASLYFILIEFVMRRYSRKVTVKLLLSSINMSADGNGLLSCDTS